MADIDRLREFRRGAEWGLAVATALELGLVDALADGPASSRELAARLSLDPRGTSALLGALEGLGAAREDRDGWRLTGPARARLVDPDTPDFEGDSLRHWLRTVRRWSADLPDAVRRGRGPERAGPGQGAGDREDLAAFMAAMANRSPAMVAAVADRILDVAPGTGTLLDVGGGPGAYARGLAERGLRVTLFDTPDVIDLVSDAYGLADAPGISLAAGDFLETLPEGPFDAVLLANVTHIYGPAENAALIRRAASRLGPGGLLAVLDFVRGESDFAPLFALTMLLSTESGGTWSRAEYARWMEDAGLGGVRCASVGPDAQLLTARRVGKGAS